jgi:hypothetical protein
VHRKIHTKGRARQGTYSLNGVVATLLQLLYVRLGHPKAFHFLNFSKTHPLEILKHTRCKVRKENVNENHKNTHLSLGLHGLDLLLLMLFRKLHLRSIESAVKI